MKTNVKAREIVNQPKELSSFEKLQRTCCTALLGESTFYEDGESLKNRVLEYMNDITKDQAIAVVKEAKDDNKLRHMPLFLVNNMLKKGWVTSDLVEHVCSRPDDVTEILAMYWNDKTNKHTLPKQLAKGLQKSLNNFDRYQLSKYRASDSAIKLRDAIRIVRPDPHNSKNEDQSLTYKDIVNGTLKMDENTWEVGLSKCHTNAEKNVFWTDMLTAKNDKGYNKLGSLALLRNLRNMKEVGVNETKIREALKSASMKKILPFQIIAAAKYAPELSDVLQDKLLESMENYDKLEGDTLFLMDVSSSMGSPLSSKSELTHVDAGAGLAAIMASICNNSIVYKFTTRLEPVNRAYKGFAMINSILDNDGGATYVIRCTNEAIKKYRDSHDGKFPKRVIVITDEQDNLYHKGCYGTPLMNLPKSSHGYIVNVGTYENGVNYNDKSWTHISGWSEGIAKFISEYEKHKFN